LHFLFQEPKLSRRYCGPSFEVLKSRNSGRIENCHPLIMVFCSATRTLTVLPLSGSTEYGLLLLRPAGSLLAGAEKNGALQ
jgi:hypothetical protein